jgi:hypothetical protein
MNWYLRIVATFDAPSSRDGAAMEAHAFLSPEELATTSDAMLLGVLVSSVGEAERQLYLATARAVGLQPFHQCRSRCLAQEGTL